MGVDHTGLTTHLLRCDETANIVTIHHHLAISNAQPNMTDNPERVTVPSIDSIDELWRCVADCATQYHRVHKDKQLGVFLTNFVEETFLSVKENVGTQDGDKWERRGRSLRHVHYLTPHVLDVFNNDIRQCHTAYADNTERGGDGVTQLQRTLDECTKVGVTVLAV